MKTTLITGGAGFIGSHLCNYLIEEGHGVVCVDNLITGSKENIKHLQKNKNFKFIKADVTQPINPALLAGRQLTNQQINLLFHLASPASPVDYQKYPEETALTNSLGTINVLNLAKKTNAKVLIASTSEVYGDPRQHPQKESYWGYVNPFGPRSCYDESKRFSEAITYVYIQKYGVDARIVRIFNTYGPRMQKDDGRAVSNFINQALEKKPLTVYGDGSQTRSFCYVSDMVEGIFKAISSKGTKGEVFNLGNPEEYKVIDLAKKIKKMTNSKSRIVFKPLPADDPRKRRPDIAKAKRILKWKPKVSLDEGLAKTIDYYRSL